MWPACFGTSTRCQRCAFEKVQDVNLEPVGKGIAVEVQRPEHEGTMPESISVRLGSDWRVLA